MMDRSTGALGEARAPGSDMLSDDQLRNLALRGFTRRGLFRVAGWKSGAMPATAMAAAHAMLGDSDLVGVRKAANTKRRDALMAFFDEHGFTYTPSRSSKLMVDTGMPTRTVIDAMAKRGVYIGRPWPVWPTHTRISIGSDADMERFRSAFLEVTRG